MKQFDPEEHERVDYDKLPSKDIGQILEMICQKLDVILVVERYGSTRYGSTYRFVGENEHQKP